MPKTIRRIELVCTRSYLTSQGFAAAKVRYFIDYQKKSHSIHIEQVYRETSDPREIVVFV